MSSKFDNIIKEIHNISRECNNPYNDGISSFEFKKDLYQIKFVVDHALESCPIFQNEKEWLDNQSKKRVIDILRSS